MASHSSPDIPVDGDEQRALATEIAKRADDSPEQIDETDVRSAVALIESGQEREDFETAVTAAEIFQNLFNYPDHFEPVVDDIIALSDAYPPDVEGIPAPVEWYSSAELRTIVYVADALRRAAQKDPSIAVPHTDSLCNVVFGDENTPRHHVFTLGYAATVDPSEIPVDDLRARLKSLRDRGSGNGHPTFAEATLDAFDDAGVDLSQKHDTSSDEDVTLADLEGFDDEPERIAAETELLEDAIEADERAVRVKALELVTTAATPETIRQLPQNAVIDALEDDDEAVVEAAVEATVKLTNIHTDGETGHSKFAITPEWAVRRFGAALTRPGLDDASFTLADGIENVADAAPDVVKTLVDQYVDTLNGADDVRYADSVPGAARALALLATRLPETITEFDEAIAAHIDHEDEEVRANVVQTLGIALQVEKDEPASTSKTIHEALQKALNDENATVRRAAYDAVPDTLTTEDATPSEDTTGVSDPFADLTTVMSDAGGVTPKTLDGLPTLVYGLSDPPEMSYEYPAVELLNAGVLSENANGEANEWRLLSVVDPDNDAREKTAQSRRSNDATEPRDSIGDDPAAPTLNVARIPDVSTARPSDGCTFAELVVGDHIGEGGFAEVHEAWLDDTRLALKQPKMRGTLTQSTIERFAEEAQTWTKLDSDPHVVTLLDWGQTPTPWIAMEYLDGGDLRARLDGPDRLDIAERLWIAAVLTETVANIHHLGVRHLDLKPANVLFQQTTGDSWAIPKIGDWGVAKIQLSRDRETNPLTPEYAAPEQFGSETLDHQTDIYQLGALCYELLTGRTPADDGVDVTTSGGNVQPTHPSTLRSDLPQSIDEPLLTALAFDKRDRYDSAIYLRDALEEAFHDVVKGTPNIRP